LTTRGLKEEDMVQVAEFIHKGYFVILNNIFLDTNTYFRTLLFPTLSYWFDVQYFSGILLAQEVQTKSGPKFVDFSKTVLQDPFKTKIAELKNQVESFAAKFFMPVCPTN
jgi:glycine/serine hydroxymethyltransferase